MTALLTRLGLFTALVTSALATNYDESRVGDYTLPDPLVCQDGSRVTNAATWFARQRPEILASYQEDVFGRSPAPGTNVTFNVWETATNALDGRAVRQQIEINFSGTPRGPVAHLLLYTPAGKKSAPTFLCLQFSGNFTMSEDPAIAIFPVWNAKTRTLALPVNPVRGEAASHWRIAQTLARGYGIAFVDYREIEPDLPGGAGFPYGVRNLFPPPAAGDWGAIGAWA